MKLASLVILVLSVVLKMSDGAPASPHGFKEAQPDGTETPTLFINGDHSMNYLTDKSGYTVTKDKDGWFVYAEEMSGELIPTEMVVGIDDPDRSGLTKHVKPNRRRLSDEVYKQSSSSLSSSLLRGTKKQTQIPSNRDLGLDTEIPTKLPPGVMKNLVVLIRFKDHEFRRIPSQRDINELMNNDGPDGIIPTGSVNDVIKKNSYGKMTMDSYVMPWVTISKTEADCSGGRNGYTSYLTECMREALQMLDDMGVDFSQWDVDADGHFDGIMFMHSGYGAEWGANDCFDQHWKNRIWSHKWTMPDSLHWTADGVTFNRYHITSALWGTCGDEIARVGAIAHETGHFISLPDLYDSDGSGNGSGNYELMANMWGWRNNQWFPPLMSCWTKEQLGWIEPIEVNEPGVYKLEAAGVKPDCIKVTEGFADGEYLLIENRQAEGYDLYMPGGGGLAVWHVDMNNGLDEEGHPNQKDFPKNGLHYRLSLLQHDGKYDLEQKTNRGDYGDLFREGDELRPDGLPSSMSYEGGKITETNIWIYDISAPGPEMSFSISFSGNKEEPSDLVTLLQGNTLAQEIEIAIESNLEEEESCIDDPEYAFRGKDNRDCEWVANRGLCSRCENGVCIRDSCRKSCDACS